MLLKTFEIEKIALNFTIPFTGLNFKYYLSEMFCEKFNIQFVKIEENTFK